MIEANNDEVICPKCVTQFRAVPVNVQDMLRAQAAEIERLNHKDKLITKWTENGDLIERLYSAGVQQEHELARMAAERDTLAAQVKVLREALEAVLQWIDDYAETTGFETVEAQADAALQETAP